MTNSHARTLLRLIRLLALAALLAAPAAHAQTTTVSGTVTNPDGTPAAIVEVLLSGRTSVDSAYTDDNGAFAFPAVAAGTYRLETRADGLIADILEIVVNPGTPQRHAINLRREGGIEHSMVVTGRNKDILEWRETDLSSTLSGDFISKIPLQNKRLQDMLAMFPSVIRVGSSDSAEISVGGGGATQIGYRVNGVSFNDPVDGGAGLGLPSAAIESFKLIAGGGNAEHGDQSSGIALIVTKSGSNETDFAYEVNFRDTDYGAQSLSELANVQKFVDERLRSQESLLSQEIDAGFDLLGVNQISSLEDDHDPPSRRRVRHTVSTGGPIKRDKVFFHSTLESLADDYGSAYVDGTFQNDQILWTSKVNWNLHSGSVSSNNLELTASLDVSEQEGFAGFAASPDLQEELSNGAWTLAATDIHMFNGTTVLDSKVSLQHQYETRRPANVRTGVGTSYQVPLPPGGSFSYFVGSPNTQFDETVNALRAETALSKSFDRHNFKVGVLVAQTAFESYIERGPDVADFRIIDDTGLGALPELVGREVTYGPPIRTDDSAWATSGYVQDNWNVTDSLVLDLGVRADYQSFVGEIFLAPRFGFSLDPIGDTSTRFFGSWGIFYDNLFANALQWTQNPSRLWANIYFAPDYSDRAFRSISIVDIYKEALSTPITPPPGSVASLQPYLEDRYVLSDRLSAPTNKDWNIGIERRLPGDMRFQLGYRSAKRTHQLLANPRTVSEATEVGERTVRDLTLESTGSGEYRGWTAELQRPFNDRWEMNFSYAQSKNVGPIAPPEAPIDPNDVYFVKGVQGNDRTHLVKLQGRIKLPWGIDASADFTWQTGTAITPTLLNREGQVSRPLGYSVLRLPSTRQLNFGMSRVFQTADKKVNMTARLQFFNLLNQLNVVGAIGSFKAPEGTSNAFGFAPLRPELLVTDVDVSRSVELAFTVNF